jgi:hypothetical protein
MRKLALLFIVAAGAGSLATPAAAGPPSVKEIVDDLIVCVTEPCP